MLLQAGPSVWFGVSGGEENLQQPWEKPLQTPGQTGTAIPGSCRHTGHVSAPSPLPHMQVPAQQTA